MADRLHRIRFLLGCAAIEKLRASHVMVVGCGAVGSFAIEALARSGIGHITVVDFDTVEESNINRQLFALTSTIGMPKVDVAAARIRDINPDTIVTPCKMFFDAQNAPDVHPDFVIDAIDSVDSKIVLYNWCNARKVPFISSMGAARKTDPSQIRVGRLSKTSVCPLAAKIRRLARDAHIPDFPVVYSTEPANPNVAAGRVFGSIITITGAFGLNCANYAIKSIVECA